MKRSLIIFVFGMIIGGVLVALIPVHYLMPSPKESALELLKVVEEQSREYFWHKDPSARGNAQAFYISYSARAWDNGTISDSDFHRAQAIGLLRFCIVKEQLGETDVAEKSCKLAKRNLTQWRPKMSFEEFRKIVNSEDFMWYTLPNKELNSTPESGAN